MRLRPVEIDAGDIEAQPAQPVGLGSEQLARARVPTRCCRFGHCGQAHNGRPRNCHPGLTCGSARRNKRRAMRCPPSAAVRQRRQAPRQGERWSLLRFLLMLVVLAWALRSFVVAPFSIPSGLDAADALHRRLSGRREMALRLFALQLPVRLPAVQRPALRASSRTRRRRGLPPPDRKCRSDQAGDRPSRRHRRGARRRGDPQRQAAAARSAGPSPCRSAPTARAGSSRRPRRVRQHRRQRPDCLYPAYRETLPGGPSLHSARPGRRCAADDFPPTTVPPAICS